MIPKTPDDMSHFISYENVLKQPKMIDIIWRSSLNVSLQKMAKVARVATNLESFLSYPSMRIIS